MSRIFNFSAGPSTLPVEVLEQVRDELLDFRGSGMSVMEMSHRSEAFEAILAEAEADLRSLMEIPEDYSVLFLQGGASLQFTMVPLCLLGPGSKADYVITGTWAEKAEEAARVVGQTDVVFSDKANGYRNVPVSRSIDAQDVAYVHITSNETIQGVEFPADWTAFGNAPVVVDMSSDILSRPVDVTKYGLIYAGAQKNMGPAGATVVIIHRSVLERVIASGHLMLDYNVYAKNNSMYNTPPTFSIYVCGLVYKKLLADGGLSGAFIRNKAKATVLYEAIDRSNGFYTGHASSEARSLMNITFTLPSEDLTKEFIRLTASEGLDGLKGHRSVGGIRASIYNAFPKAGCEKLAEVMDHFAARHG